MKLRNSLGVAHVLRHALWASPTFFARIRTPDLLFSASDESFRIAHSLCRSRISSANVTLLFLMVVYDMAIPLKEQVANRRG